MIRVLHRPKYFKPKAFFVRFLDNGSCGRVPRSSGNQQGRNKSWTRE
jgi:hypothetical protein